MVKCAGHNILVIDDSKILRMLVARMLTTEGFVCETTPDARKALTFLRESPSKYDCILLDYMMPEMDGLEFLQCVETEQLFPMAKIIMVSASPDTLKPYQEQYGFSAIVAKPFNLGTLVSVVRHAGKKTAASTAHV